MHLTAMSEAFAAQINDPKMKLLPFEDRFSLLVDIEYDHRRENGIKRLIRNAGFSQPEATIADINYNSGRNLSREAILGFAACGYITDRRNLVITGATGSGKSYLACALGIEACKQRYSTKYIRLPELLFELEASRGTAMYYKVLEGYVKPQLLIIDEWLLLKTAESACDGILALLDRRQGRSSTIFCSQYEIPGWYERLCNDNAPLAESILDRIKHNAYEINIVYLDTGNSRSMREIYGLKNGLGK